MAYHPVFSFSYSKKCSSPFCSSSVSHIKYNESICCRILSHLSWNHSLFKKKKKNCLVEIIPHWWLFGALTGKEFLKHLLLYFWCVFNCYCCRWRINRARCIGLQKKRNSEKQSSTFGSVWFRRRHCGGEIRKNGPFAGRYFGATHSEMRLL